MPLFAILAVILVLTGAGSVDAESCPAACNRYLVSEVADSQLSQSAYWCQNYDCTIYPDGSSKSGSAIYARLNSTGYANGAWTAPELLSTNNAPLPDNVEVDFGCPKTILGIVINGRDPALIPGHGDSRVHEYVTSFKVRYSADCQTYRYIAAVFQGNTSPDDVQTRYFSYPVAARCVMVIPVHYVGKHKSLRFDVIGC